MLLVVIKIIVLSIFEWPFYTGFTVCIFMEISIGLIRVNKEYDQHWWEENIPLADKGEQN